ncbi:hypothetical protein SAMN05443094_104216 [Domibacillus enclensis]|uniref:Uncharacterized protein n=1 Tax=Domibacillus enclensis TaxID=1017273 RepID=A0A1N6WMC2_9BACI|nr:hypothetical protein SAMN05443094_104216 [Domibacillus enclensis]
MNERAIPRVDGAITESNAQLCVNCALFYIIAPSIWFKKKYGFRHEERKAERSSHDRSAFSGFIPAFGTHIGSRGLSLDEGALRFVPLLRRKRFYEPAGEHIKHLLRCEKKLTIVLKSLMPHVHAQHVPLLFSCTSCAGSCR